MSYPVVTLVKSCKLVPVMIAGALIGGKRFSALEYLCCVMISAGVVLFTCLKPNMGVEASNLVAIAIGCGLVLINLAFDGATNAMQDRLYEKHSVTSFQLMFGMNLIGALLLIAALCSPFDLELAFSALIGDTKAAATFAARGGYIAGMWKGFDFVEVADGLRFLLARPEAARDVALFALCGASGQIFIFTCIREFGSLVNTIITITRKFFSILFSLAYFGHAIGGMQMIGVALVFGGLGLEIWVKASKPKKAKGGESGKTDAVVQPAIAAATDKNKNKVAAAAGGAANAKKGN